MHSMRRKDTKGYVEMGYQVGSVNMRDEGE